MSDNITQPAIDELYKAYDILYPELSERLGTKEYRVWKQSEGKYEEGSTPPAPKPVIRIETPGKRVAKSWYKLNAWNTDIDDTLAVMTGEAAQARDEIIFSTKVFDDTPESILVELTKQMIHVIKHQYVTYSQWEAPTFSTNAKTGIDYVNKEYTYVAGRIGFEQTGKRNQDITLGESRHSTKAEKTRNSITTALTQLDPDAFSITNKGVQHQTNAVAVMKKWQCACTNIRTTSYVEMKCELCGEDFKYADKDSEATHMETWLAENAKKYKTGPYALQEMDHRKRVLRFKA